MNTPLQIRGKKMDLTPALKQHVNERTEKLEKYFDRVTKAMVTLQKNQRHTKGFYTCEANIFIPKTTIHAKETKDTMHEAIDASFSIIERELRRHTEKIQEARKKPEEKEKTTFQKLAQKFKK